MRIEAGKFYINRAGEKVGPMVVEGVYAWPEGSEGQGKTVWADTGFQYPKGEPQEKDDLIAASTKHGGPSGMSIDELKANGYYVPEKEGRKDDAAKIRYELLPPEFLDGTADILTFGAKKYGDRNWEKGMAWSRVFGALMRHLWAWWRGEAGDPETGKSHLWHAACCLAFLMAYEARKSGQDDRPVSMS